MSRYNSADIGFWRLVFEDLEMHGGGWSKPGFQAMFMYRLGAQSERHNVLFGRLLKCLYLPLHLFIRNVYGIELHASATLGRRVRIANQGIIVIHEFAEIGDDCIIRQGATIGASVGGASYLLQAPRLGRAVDVGVGAVVIGKVVVGNDVRIGPQSVVMKNVPAGSTVVGPVAEVISSPLPVALPGLTSSGRA